MLTAGKVFVYDGDVAYRDGLYRVVIAAKNATVGVILVSW